MNKKQRERGDSSQTVTERACASCGLGPVLTSIVEDRFTYGEGEGAAELVAEVPLRKCEACGFQFLDEEAEDAQHEAVCTYLNVLKPSEIRALRKKYAVSRAEFSRITKLGEATLSRWENGALIQNGANDQFLYLLGFPENVERLISRVHGEMSSAVGRSNGSRFQKLQPTPRLLEQAASFKLIAAA